MSKYSKQRSLWNPELIKLMIKPMKISINKMSYKICISMEGEARVLPVHLCISSPDTLDLVRHAYNLYNNMSKNPAEPLFLSDPAQRD
jgi:hypothetical protein